MNIEDYLLNSTLNAVLAQRLVRTLCPDCRRPYRAPQELLDQLQWRNGPPSGEVTLYRAEGCPACNKTGYRGRSMILELLVMSDPIRQLVLRHAEAREIQKAAIEEGMITMYEDGLAKALAGSTTIEEVLRVIRDT
jgi:general secretion pathway protein E